LSPDVRYILYKNNLADSPVVSAYRHIPSEPMCSYQTMCSINQLYKKGFHNENIVGTGENYVRHNSVLC